MGIAVRDEDGLVVAAMCANRPYISDPATAEAIAAWMLADLSNKLGFKCIIMEEDSLEIVLSLQREGECRGSYEHFVDDTKYLLNQLEVWNVQHVGRDANTVAHQLAQHAVTLEGERIWTSDFPNFIWSFVISEQEAI